MVRNNILSAKKLRWGIHFLENETKDVELKCTDGDDEFAARDLQPYGLSNPTFRSLSFFFLYSDRRYVSRM